MASAAAAVDLPITIEEKGGPDVAPGPPGPRGAPAQSACRVFEEVRRLAGDCQEDPSAELGAISTQDLEEIRQMRHPPAVVRRTLEVTFLLLNASKAPARPAPPAWERVQRMLCDSGFLGRMLRYDAAALQAAPVLAAYVAAEYFDPEPTHRKALPKRNFLGRLTQRLEDFEPLTLKRVQRASLAVAALFKWSAAMLAQASEADPGAPELAEEAEAAEEAEEAQSPLAAPLAAQEPPAEPDPAPQATLQAPPAPPPAPSRAPVAPRAPPQEAARPPKPPIPADARPDRHFELLVPFELGSAALCASSEPAMQTVAATWLMRRRLQLRLVSTPFELEHDALGAKRLNVSQEWLYETGGLRDAGMEVQPSSRTATGDPGVTCELRLDGDRVLRDFYLLVEQGEKKKDAGTADTQKFAQWLAENFEQCMH